jgi:flavin reductase (DIM6/NTAB) family NADH-FMN oxidoreductase RutF
LSVEFHVQSSIEPQRYRVLLSKANYTYPVALRSSHLVIHFLTADDLPLAGTHPPLTAGLGRDTGLCPLPRWPPRRPSALPTA